MHDGGGNRNQTVAALAPVLEKLGKQGYRFVTIPELLQMRQQEPAPHFPNHGHSRQASARKPIAKH
jgi:hypothetical protein